MDLQQRRDSLVTLAASFEQMARQREQQGLRQAAWEVRMFLKGMLRGACFVVEDWDYDTMLAEAVGEQEPVDPAEPRYPFDVEARQEWKEQDRGEARRGG